MRCWASASETLNVNVPRLHVLLRAVSCMPPTNERRTTSSPEDGLPVVPFVTLPAIFAANREVERSRQHAINRIWCPSPIRVLVSTPAQGEFLVLLLQVLLQAGPNVNRYYHRADPRRKSVTFWLHSLLNFSTPQRDLIQTLPPRL